jgi:hypothetical protein
MKNSWMWLGLVLGIATCAALVCLFPATMASPGGLRQGHQDLAGDCLKCHKPFQGAPRENCVACHQVDKIGLVAVQGKASAATRPRKAQFHQHLQEQDCVACHPEHRDSAVNVAEPQFNHQLVNAAVRGDCPKCHQAPKDVAHRWIATDCDGCHTNTEWVPATCDHRKTFRLDSDHKPNCRTCHSYGDYRKFTCYGCHEHSAAKVERKHIKEGIRDFQKCAQCHRSASTHEAKRNLRLQEGGGPVRRAD